MPQIEQFELFSSLIFWSVLSFAILFVLMWKFAIPPIMQALEDREKKISGDIQSAEDLRAEADPGRGTDDFGNHSQVETVISLS